MDSEGIQRVVIPEEPLHCGAEEQRHRPGEQADDHRAVGGDEAELLAVAAVGAQVEARGAQPAYRQGLELVAGIEDPERAAVEVLASIERRAGVFVDQLARARLADPAAAEIRAWTLLAIAVDQCAVD